MLVESIMSVMLSLSPADTFVEANTMDVTPFKVGIKKGNVRVNASLDDVQKTTRKGKIRINNRFNLEEKTTRKGKIRI